MNSLRFPLALALALMVGAVWAQTKPAPAASAAAMDCEKARHDHGAEKGSPTPKSARCAAEASKGKKTEKAHDHQKVHNK